MQALKSKQDYYLLRYGENRSVPITHMHAMDCRKLGVALWVNGKTMLVTFALVG